MKAKDYYVKYGEQLVSADEKEREAAILAVMKSFADESKALMDARKPRTEKQFSLSLRKSMVVGMHCAKCFPYPF